MLVPSCSILWATNVLDLNYNTGVSWHTKTQRIFQPTLCETCNARKCATEIDIKNKVHKLRLWETGSLPY